MSLNCTELIRSVYHEKITDVLYLREDNTSCLSTDYLKEPGYIVIAFVITYSLLCSCIVFPLRLPSQKRITLRILHQKGIMESQFVLPLLDKHTDGQRHISQLVADFAGYHFVDSVDQFVRRVNTRCEHVSDSVVYFFICYILTGTLLYCSFIPIYTISRHWNDSYALFLRTECTYYDSRNMTVVDVHSLCDPNSLDDAEEYTFSLEWDTVELYGNDSEDMDCYVNTEHYKVRSPLHNGFCGKCYKCCKCGDVYCCPELRNRCGRFGGGNDSNICCIPCCLSGVVALISCWIRCVCATFASMDEKYEITDGINVQCPHTAEEVELMIAKRHSNTAYDSNHPFLTSDWAFISPSVVQCYDAIIVNLYFYYYLLLLSKLETVFWTLLSICVRIIIVPNLTLYHLKVKWTIPNRYGTGSRMHGKRSWFYKYKPNCIKSTVKHHTFKHSKWWSERKGTR